jgi:hypothetical protein
LTIFFRKYVEQITGSNDWSADFQSLSVKLSGEIASSVGQHTRLPPAQGGT